MMFEWWARRRAEAAARWQIRIEHIGNLSLPAESCLLGSPALCSPFPPPPPRPHPHPPLSPHRRRCTRTRPRHRRPPPPHRRLCSHPPTPPFVWAAHQLVPCCGGRGDWVRGCTSSPGWMLIPQILCTPCKKTYQNTPSP